MGSVLSVLKVNLVNYYMLVQCNCAAFKLLPKHFYLAFVCQFVC